jgi:monoamine oxidase
VDGDALVDRGAGAPPTRVRGGAGARIEGLRFAAGAGAMAERLAAKLPAGTVRLGARVEMVRGWGGAGGAGGAEVEAVEGGARRVFGARVAVVLALPPALVAATVAFEPPLPAAAAAIARATPTWMGATAKTLVTYERAFWRDAGLSGTAFGAAGGGPLSEIYDHCAPGGGAPFALFGFSRGAPAPAAVVEQLARLFGERARAPLAVETADWSAERFTAGAAGAFGGGGDGDPRRHYGDRLYSRAVGSGGGGGAMLLWSSTETSAEAAGHIEGALRAADRAVALIVAAAGAARGADASK